VKIGPLPSGVSVAGQTITFTVPAWTLVGIEQASSGGGGQGTLLGLTELGTRGSFDASLVNGSSGYMSYSSVNASTLYPQNSPIVSTRLAQTTDSGSTWSDIGLINAVTEPAASLSWNNEVSSLVFDVTDPGPAAWKLFWHHYLVNNGTSAAPAGWIGLKSASTVSGLLSASEQKLFAATAYDTNNNTLNGSTGSPLGGAPDIMVASINAALSSCVTMTEPGAVANASGLYLAMNCMFDTGGSVYKPKIVLLVCAAPCSAPTSLSSWAYVNTLITPTDASFLGHYAYSAANLLINGSGTAYLIATPTLASPMNQYSTCDVFAFVNLKLGQLYQSSGHPSPLANVHGDTGTFNGACTFQTTMPNAGYIYGQVDSSGGFAKFHLYSTGTQFGLPATPKPTAMSHAGFID
jgi:hypothetical protein